MDPFVSWRSELYLDPFDKLKCQLYGSKRIQAKIHKNKLENKTEPKHATNPIKFSNSPPPYWHTALLTCSYLLSTNLLYTFSFTMSSIPSIKVLRTNEYAAQLRRTTKDWRYELYMNHNFEMQVRSKETFPVPISLRIAFPEGTYGRITSIPRQRWVESYVLTCIHCHCLCVVVCGWNLTHPILHHTTHHHRQYLKVDAGEIDDEGRIDLELFNRGGDVFLKGEYPVAYLIVEQVRGVTVEEVRTAEELL